MTLIIVCESTTEFRSFWFTLTALRIPLITACDNDTVGWLQAMKIHISETTQQKLQDYPYKTQFRGEIQVKVTVWLIEKSDTMLIASVGGKKYQNVQRV